MFERFWDKLYPRTPHDLAALKAGHGEALAALRAAEASCESANANNGEVKTLVCALRAQGERNHFADLLEASIRKSN